jgi:hypothetical protein
MNKRTERIFNYVCIALNLITLTLSGFIHAQSGSIVPKQDTISPQVSHNAPYSYFPVYSFDTTKEGVIMIKVAECKNGVWTIKDSMKTIELLYQKIK